MSKSNRHKYSSYDIIQIVKVQRIRFEFLHWSANSVVLQNQKWSSYAECASRFDNEKSFFPIKHPGFQRSWIWIRFHECAYLQSEMWNFECSQCMGSNISRCQLNEILKLRDVVHIIVAWNAFLNKHSENWHLILAFIIQNVNYFDFVDRIKKQDTRPRIKQSIWIVHLWIVKLQIIFQSVNFDLKAFPIALNRSGKATVPVGIADMLVNSIVLVNLGHECSIKKSL